MNFFRRQKNTDYTVCSDEELMVLINRQEEKAFDELYHRYSRRLFYFFLRMNGNDEEAANDLVQETFLRVFEKSDRYLPEKKFSSWFFTIAANLYKNTQRSLGREGARIVALTAVQAKHEEPLSGTLDEKSFRASLEKALGTLDETQRMVFVLRFIEELTIPEIAVILECPEGTVKSRIYYVQRKLGESLREYAPHYNPASQHEN